jgi:hypothetical protein
MAEADNVVYVRLSLATPKAGHEEDVARMDDDLMRFFASQPGYLNGYRITGGDAIAGRIGRLSLWRSDRDADAAAQTDHVLSIRSEILLLIADERHIEYSWTAQTFEPTA